MCPDEAKARWRTVTPEKEKAHQPEAGAEEEKPRRQMMMPEKEKAHQPEAGPEKEKPRRGDADHKKEYVTLREALGYGKAYLAERGVADADVDAWLLLEFVSGIGRARFLAEQSAILPGEKWERYQALLAKRGSRIPLQHLTGEQEFMGLSFLVNEHVLIPRQDTEILVEEALKRMEPGERALDLCTGSGCIAVSLAVLGKASVDGADISEEALEVARRNGARLGGGVSWIQSDLFSGIQGEYGMIVSNPPYIPTSVIAGLSPEVRLYEPFQALDGKEDGLYFYRRITAEAGLYLREGGWLLFEIGFDQGEAVRRLLEESQYEDIEIIKDLAGLDRVAAARLGAGNRAERAN